MIFVKISQNFIKSHLKICIISRDFSPQLMACMWYWTLCDYCLLWNFLHFLFKINKIKEWWSISLKKYIEEPKKMWMKDFARKEVSFLHFSKFYGCPDVSASVLLRHCAWPSKTTSITKVWLISAFWCTEDTINFVLVALVTDRESQKQWSHAMPWENLFSAVCN